MQKLAESSGTVLYETDNKLYLTKRPARWTATALFVIGLLAVIILANGFLQLFFLDPQSRIEEPIGVILLGVGILFTLIFWRIIVYRKKLNARPVNKLECICIIDLAGNNLLDAQQQVLASLADVQLHGKMQITSSSPSLLLTWPGNSITIVEGNPFSGGIDAVEKALISKGIKRK